MRRDHDARLPLGRASPVSSVVRRRPCRVPPPWSIPRQLRDEDQLVPRFPPIPAGRPTLYSRPGAGASRERAQPGRKSRYAAAIAQGRPGCRVRRERELPAGPGCSPGRARGHQAPLLTRSSSRPPAGAAFDAGRPRATPPVPCARPGCQGRRGSRGGGARQPAGRQRVAQEPNARHAQEVVGLHRGTCPKPQSIRRLKLRLPRGVPLRPSYPQARPEAISGADLGGARPFSCAPGGRLQT